MLLHKAKTWGLQMIGLLLFNAFTARSMDAQSLQTGLKFKYSQESNVGAVYSSFVTTEYQIDSGRCYGAVYVSNPQTYSRNDTEKESGYAVFISRTTPPALGLRVIIRNVTFDINQNPSPYTDREYDKIPTSEGFEVDFGTQHNGGYLAVREGQNNFLYEIKRANTVIESGSFTATIRHQTKTIARNETSSSPFINQAAKDAECQRALDEQKNGDRKHH